MSGICGAKNIYSSKVKLDNWVEDDIGVLLSSKPRPPVTLYATNAMVSHCHPNQWPALEIQTGMLSTHDLKVKNKTGMPYDLLFDHGMHEIPPDERFKTNTMYTMEKKNDLVFGPQPRRHLEKTKAKQIKNEINLAQMKTTEARSMNGQTSNATLILNKSCGRAERLPEWRRQGLLTSTFPKA